MVAAVESLMRLMENPERYLAMLGSEVEVRVDRPLGTHHPDYPELRYETNHGYIPGTLAGDGEEIDAYVLGVDQPLETFHGLCVAVILRRADLEHKLVVADRPMAVERIRRETAFVEKDFDTEIIVLESDTGVRVVS